MLEGLAAWILRTYVGEYVENLNTDQLSIGVGTVDLHNLPLKKTALKGLDLPLEVKSGFIGHLQLSIPLRRPKSEPWIIHINKLYLVAGPQQLNKYNEEEEKQSQWTRKKKQLDAFESQWQESQQKDQAGGFWYGSWWPSLYSSFSTTIVENLQLFITDVHVRYEDGLLDKQIPFAFGITIERLSAQSTNENWDTEEIIQNERMIKYKLMDLQNLAVYWDQDVTLVGDLPSSDLKSALQRMINRYEGCAEFSKHQYILEPISANTKVQRNASLLPLKDKKPRFVIDLHVERIPFALAEFQYRKMMKLVGEFQRSFRQSRYKKWRPTVPVKKNAKLWWQFSITCILYFIQERNKHHSWAFAASRVHDITTYVKAYTLHLTNGVMEDTMKEAMDRIEHELTFEELVVLRRIAMDKTEKEIELQKELIVESTGNTRNQSTPNAPPGQSQGSWMSGWYSWYWQGSTAATTATDNQTQTPPLVMSPPSTQEEEEFLDELSGRPLGNQSIFNRDKVFAHLNIHLGSGCFKLLKAKETNVRDKIVPIIELEFTNARWESEVRPQSSTWEFKMSLGAIHVRDKVNEGTLFPALVAPQVKKARSPASVTKASVGALALSSASFGLNIIQDFSEPPVFEMKFVQLPPNSKLTYNFSMTTEPLDITYNPLVIECVTDFFSNDSLNAQYMNVERQLKEAAWLRYEELKNQTKAELQHTLDSMLEGVEMNHFKRWDIQLEISAPRVFVPENFKNRKASVVLIDFGHLSFKSSEAMEREQRLSGGLDNDQDDDSFVTPLSTPPSEIEDEEGFPPDMAMKLADSLNPEDIQSAMYDKYTFILSDIQMMVCHARDVYKQVVHTFGSTDLHVVDKFTISLFLDRRIMFTADPQYPALCLSGNLPSLFFHINEHKCHALTKCVKQLTNSNDSNLSCSKNNKFTTSTPRRPPSVDATSKEDLNQSMDELYYSLYSSQVTLNDSPMPSRRPSKSIIEAVVASKTRELMEESKLFMLQFSIDQVSCGVHSRGRLIAELQVLGVSSEYLQRPYDNSMSLKIHGLQLVDAIQGYGPDYELLLSSSRRNWMDSTVKNTSIKDDRTVAEAVTSAFSAMADFMRPGTKDKSTSLNQSVSSEPTMTASNEDLISLDYHQISEECPSTDKALRLVTLQFNTINCIANQETLAILMQFFNSAFPNEDDTPSGLQSVPDEPTPVLNEDDTGQIQEAQPSLEVNASFRSMSILLVRSTKINSNKTVRKVAEVTVSEVQIIASFVEGQSISGSLGGLQIIDLTPEGSLHRCVLNCGITNDTDIPSENPYLMTKLPADNDDAPADSRAFKFSLLRPSATQRFPTVILNPIQNSDKEIAEITRNVQVSITMATAQYIHTQRFLIELMLCGGDFAESAKEVGESLRQAASSVAMGLVSKKKALVDELDYLSSSFIAPSRDVDTHGLRFFSDEGIVSELALKDQDLEDGLTSKPNQRVYLSVDIKAPVIHFPRSSSSADVLVANLGEITIRNTHMVEIYEEAEESIGIEYDIDQVQIDIQDMSLYSLTLSTDDLNKLSHGQTLTESLHGGSPSKVPKSGIHLLHKTGLQVCVDRRSEVQDVAPDGHKKKPTIFVDARILTPLKLELSTYTYEQLLDTVDSLTGKKTSPQVPPPASEQISPSRSPLIQSPSLSPTSSSSSFQSLLEDQAVSSRRVTFAPETPKVNGLNETSDDEPTDVEDEKTPVRSNITVPQFSIKLCGELKGVEYEFVDIMFHDFYMNFESTNPTVTVFDVYLGGLLVQDLLQGRESSYSYLMSSSLPPRPKSLHRSMSEWTSVLSTSCPTVSECGLNANLSSSLPSYFPDSPVRKGIPFRTLSPLRPLKHEKSPSLPSVSLIEEGKVVEETNNEAADDKQNHKDNALVAIQVTLVQKENEEFETKYKSVNRFIKVDFNSLDTVVNLQTWVLVLDFFGIGVPQPSQSQPNSSFSAQPDVPSSAASPSLSTVNNETQILEDKEENNTEIQFKAQSLTLTVNKSQYPLAKAKVTGLACELKMREGHLIADGKLTSVSLTDMSPHGSLYREKFTSCGDEALSFHYFKYDDPDPYLQRENDMSLSLCMSSVQYVHTKRFITELIAFCQHFLQLQEVLGRMRAQSAGNEVSWMFGRSARISLDIKAGSPVILIPRSSKSPHILVADLGDLTVKNAFLWEESLGTIAYTLNQPKSLSDATRSKARQKCLLDCMTLDLQEMDLFTAIRVPATVQQSRKNFTYSRQGEKLLKEKCRLNLQIERNLDWSISKAVSDFLCSGRLSSVYASLDYSQYGLILGMLGENFGEVLEEFERPSSFLQDPLGKPPEFEEVWTTLKMSIDLVNVSLELLPVQMLKHPEEYLDDPSFSLPSLARIDFIKSKFEFETYSDWSKTIDLVSAEVIFEDMRDMDDSDYCVFKEVLLPKTRRDSEEESLQFEVHYRDTTKKTLLTFLFNHSRIVLIIDYLLDTYNFIMCKMFPVKEEPHKADQSKDHNDDQNTQGSNSPLYQSPSAAESGVVTKCELQNSADQEKKTFEMKINISGTEFVLLENLGSLETNAVVLKITAVLAWRPHLHTQKWLSCSIQSLEMFSCVYSCEEETAQSIIDPTAALIELNNARRQMGRRTAGLLDITNSQLPSVEVTLHSSFNMRISYNDYKLYLEIFESVTKQLNKAIKADDEPEQQTMEHDFDEKLVKRLVELGFKEEDCVKALIATSGRLESSATWLLENATPIVPAKAADNNEAGWKFAGFEVRAGTLCVCLIDDCGDTDVPLIEMSVQNLYFWHDLQATGDGAAHCSLTVEYYNRNVSGWEPWIEPWKAQLHWQQQQQTKKAPKRFLVKLDAPDRLDITVTSTLINMIRHTISSWTEDLYGPTEQSSLQPIAASNNGDSVSSNTSVETMGSPVNRPGSNVSLASTSSGPYRKRAPFVPYAIRNKTGCTLVFRTISSTPSRVIITNTGLKLTPHDHDPDKMSEWAEVPAGSEVPFEFSTREKMRHKDTHDFIVHQIVVRAEGWAQVSPVSVDCVGTFFRHAQPDGKAVNSVASDVQPVRIVFKVTLEGGARKVVTVQSALSITNKMDLPLEIKLQGHTSYQGSFKLPVIQPRASLTIPLHAVDWKIYARPHGVGVGFSSEAIEWNSVSKAFATVGYARECNAIGNAAKFRFCSSVRRDGYPDDDPLTEFVPRKKLKVLPQPAHSITILAPMVLVNLLPCDMTYSIKHVNLSGNIKAGRSVPLYSADTEKNLDLGIRIENFNVCETIRITKHDRLIEQTITHVELQDTRKRSLVLSVLISARLGGALKISIYAPYWLINNTGIPLVFKRESTPNEIAGQFDEHEMARSLTPLLFSFYDRDAPLRCQMRIGRSFHEGSGKPVWCTPFSLDNPREFNRVQARQANGRPDKVYDIGIDVRFGRGHYQLTKIVTFATRYQLENKTPHTLAFSQRHFVRDQGTRNPDGSLTALPGALVLFHWARTDLDQLLCIRLNDVSHCQWSGGFRIDRDDSFHINMRSINGCSLFVRVEIMLRGATFHVVFTDASQLPPPYRIDNMSEVPVKFFQAGTEDSLRTILQPKQSVPYSWDEATLLPELVLGVVDGSSQGRYFMNVLGSGERLYYYNPIYIVFTHTFTSAKGNQCGIFHARPADSSSSFDLRELVLDVPQGTAVLLRRKEPLKRSQLWRMTGSGQLRHEASSPISDPRKPSASNTRLVLDIDSLAPPTCGKYVRLVLSKPNPRRKHSQTWSFTEDGRMNCDLPGLFVQPRNGLAGLVDGADAVLGPANITKDDHIPVEQCINTCKMRPGSGCIAVQVVADGPTRVLHISDSLQQAENESDKDWLLVERKGGLRQTTVCTLDTEPDSYDLEMQVRLAGGIGVSVINAVPEELVYGVLEQIEIDYLRSSKRESLEVTIGRLQVDNQLFSSPLPVLLYPTTPEKGSKEETMIQQPTLHLSACKERSRLQNVEIFKNLDVSLRNMTLHMEERLLLKLLQFFGYVQQDDDVATNEEQDESLYDNQRAVSVSTTASKKYYFERLQLNSLELKVSVASTGRLPEDLQKLKETLGLILFNLEDATLDLDSFSKNHPFESMNSLLDSMSKHYYEGLRSQAAAIVGSIDFLGNPMGLLNDVSSGLEGLVKRGNVGGLFLNVAHGVSDSAAKITGSLSDGLWNASMDTKFQESRQAMRAERYGSSKDHFVAGVKGLGMGLVGGLTSIVTQPIQGAHNSGLSGFITGIGKGIVGTVAKPTAGVLDFASGAAAAVRGQATRSSRYIPPKQTRLRRNCFGPSGAIPRFSSTHAEGQEIMLKLNESNFNEKFVLSESVRRDKEERLKAIITTEGVYFVRAKGIPSPEAIVLLVRYSELFECQPLSGDGKDYIELVMNADNSSVPTPSKNPSKRPRVRCDSAKIAQKVAQKINYSKNLYDEVQQTVIPGPKEALSNLSMQQD